MYKSTIALAVVTLAPLGWQQELQQFPPYLQLKDEQMILEYDANTDEVVVIVEGESEEALIQVEVRTPSGSPIIKLTSQETQGLALQSFMVETLESSYAEVLQAFAEGIYDIRARTVDGEPMLGSVALSHALPPAPVITYPVEGDTNVPTSNFTVSWVPDPEASGYRVSLEQNDNDGLTVELPAGTGVFHVPDGILKPGTRTFVEVGAIGLNGNCTLVEVGFRTL